ncbi:hypothetical protein ACFXI8_13635 [Streptomyces niveus]|uniref:hypothetical protein n=1 Tax=Streptomyces niveus TaxID=193462 RepID=UPI0036A94916
MCFNPSVKRVASITLSHNAEGSPVPETPRRLVHRVLDYQNGRLQDDATVLFLKWHGPATLPAPRAIRRNPLPHTKGCS